MRTVTEFGAIGNGETINTAALQKALDACAEAGGGTLIVPPGCYLTGPLSLRSHVTLHLESGAILRAVPSMDGWPMLDDEYAVQAGGRNGFRPFLFGQDLVDVSIQGRGVIDGNGAVWWEAQRKLRLEPRRPRLICINNSRDILLSGFTALNSACWTVNPVCCENVIIEGLTVRNPYDSPNTDGINPDSCRYVRISNCCVDVGDDCITIKAGTETGSRPADRAACEHVAVTNCELIHGHGGVVCGSETSGWVRNVVISNCTLRGTDMGLRFKSRRGRGGGIKNVRAMNLIMEDVPVPFVANLNYGRNVEPPMLEPSPEPAGPGTPAIEGLHFAHITALRAQYAAAFLHGLPEMPVRDLSFHDVDISMLPDATEGYPAHSPSVPRMRKRGFFARHVNGLRLDSVRIAGMEGPRLDARHCANVRDEG
jgi:polygalacturonase